MSDYQPKRAAVLARISDARNGDEAGVDRQIADARRLSADNGWAIGPDATHIIIENDTSAYHRRKVCRNCLTPARVCRCWDKHETVLRTWRPEFRGLLAMLKSGEADGLLAYDLDRVARDPRDLEDLIDVVEAKRIPVQAKSGRIRNADDLTMARIMCAIANKSSRDTARRVARKREDKAACGEYGGGTRPFGWGAPTSEVTQDGRPVLDMSKLVDAEAAEVRRGADQVLAGVSLRTITADLRARKVTSVKGAAWDTATVRDILLKARNAGLVVYGVREAAQAYRDRGEPALPKYPVARLLIERSPAFGGFSQTLGAESRLAVLAAYWPPGSGYLQPRRSGRCGARLEPSSAQCDNHAADLAISR
jgi:site-specific DNA recombinase